MEDRSTMKGIGCLIANNPAANGAVTGCFGEAINDSFIATMIGLPRTSSFAEVETIISNRDTDAEKIVLLYSAEGKKAGKRFNAEAEIIIMGGVHIYGNAVLCGKRAGEYIALPAERIREIFRAMELTKRDIAVIQAEKGDVVFG